jgi:hypothetical protein
MFQMFQRYIASVSHGCCKKVDLDVAYYILQVFQIRYVASVCSKYFIYFWTYVASVLSGCCIYFTHMLQAYVPNVSFVSVVCCSKCFMFQVQTVGVSVDEGDRVWPQPPTRGVGADHTVSVWKRRGQVIRAPRKRRARVVWNKRTRH